MSKTFATDRKGKKGTREWADFSYNICSGCEHNCLYCYAASRTRRFEEERRLPGRWAKQALNPNRAELGQEVGAKGVVMFPTTHDLVPRFLAEAMVTIKNLLTQNQVLIVSKPHRSVIKRLCVELANHKADVLFRFTIGSLNQGLCAFWEPGAPAPKERLQCLEHAFNSGFATSVSIEPMLDTWTNTCALVAALEPFVTDTIWIGKMNNIPRKYNSHVLGFDNAAAMIKEQQSDENILRLVRALKKHPKVRWKDSIQEVVGKAAKSSGVTSSREN